MTKEEQLHDPVVEAIKILARHGRRLREAPRNVVYAGMTPEERGITVYEKVQQGELRPGQMTRLERDSYLDEIRRQMVELLREMRNLNTEYEWLNNAFWNFEYHSFLA
jgi:hypothetical protein